MNLKISKKNPLTWLYVGSVILLLIAVLLWCVKISTDPERVFWQTIERGMSSRAVTIKSHQDNNSTAADQTIRYSMGAENLSHSVTTLKQGGTTVRNEMIGTPTVDYTRYVGIKTDQKKADGAPLDFSKLIGKWAKGEEGSGQFFSQAVFGASLPIGGMGVPIGMVDSEKRAELIKKVRTDKVYQVSFDKTKKERVDGRLRYTYETTVQPSRYVGLMKKFAQSVNLHGLDQVQPDDYKEQKAFKLLITIDVRARQVVRITAPETRSEQTYSAYDVPVQIDVPKKTISGAELQELLSNLQ